MPSPPKVSLRAIKSSNTVSRDLNLVRRKRRTNIVALDDVTAQEVKDWGTFTEDVLAESHANRTYSLAISELGPGPHVVFVLRSTEQLSVKKIAQTLGLSVLAVKSRMRRVSLDFTKKLQGMPSSS